MYNVSAIGNADPYLIEGTEVYSNLTSQTLERTHIMSNEGAPEFVVDQNMYHPAAINCGYYSTGFEPLVEWEDRYRIFGVDGPDIQNRGARNENMPLVYYTPNYGYAQSPYNPYNSYIPGAMMGVDGPYVETPQYHIIPPYQNPFSSPAYFPPIVQSDIIPYLYSSSGSSFDSGATVSKTDGRVFKQNFSSVSGALTRKSLKSVSYQTGSLARVSDRQRSIAGGKKPMTHGSVSTGGIPNLASSHVHQDEQNQGSRIKSKNQLSCKASGDSDAQGNISIRSDQYNRDNFAVDYPDAKFFVIKSYSEDDVHKSIKYNVWSSTPHGNMKLNSAYEDAHKIAAQKAQGCPVFLFFSVNASGQFCGVAEMVGPVDSNKDMDFWQQDKWSGSFPVKWQIIKDVPNTNIRHIILENNENKPVTNSRDTQEIMYKEGIEMLKIFKNHTLKTSLLDDFIYYEDLEKMMQDKKAEFHIRNFEKRSFTVPASSPPRKLSFVISENKNEKTVEPNEESNLYHSSIPTPALVISNSDVADTSFRDENSGETSEDKDVTSTLKISSLAINPKQVDPKTFSAASIVSYTETPHILTTGSLPVKVNGIVESSGFIKFGTIPLNLKALQVDKGVTSVTYGSQY